jgi:hypothetical protein
VPGLTREQLELCYRASDVTTIAIDGLELAIRECQYQFLWHRWNCSSLSTKSKNPHSSSLLKRGKPSFRERRKRGGENERSHTALPETGELKILI